MDKESEALDIIREALEATNSPVVGFSGGKDSTVVLDLVRRCDPTVEGVFCNTGVEWPETVRYVNETKNVTTIQNQTDETFWTISAKEGLPSMKGKGKVRVNRCCNVLKDKPMRDYIVEKGIDLVFDGLTMDESRQRMMFLMSNGNKGHIKWVGSWKVNKAHPIWNWTVEEVWEYLHKRNLPYNNIYKPPINAVRCGCLPCTAYTSWKRRLATENPKMLRVVLRLQGQNQIEDFSCSGGS